MRLQEEISRVFERARAERTRLSTPARLVPAIDVVVTDEAYLLWVDLPGVRAEEVRVVAEDGALVIRGEKRTDEARGRTLRSERRFGQFVRVLPLPSDADVTSASARLEKGVLQISIGRRPRGGRVEIPVQAAE